MLPGIQGGAESLDVQFAASRTQRNLPVIVLLSLDRRLKDNNLSYT